jgi:hypothetical protein
MYRPDGITNQNLFQSHHLHHFSFFTRCAGIVVL